MGHHRHYRHPELASRGPPGSLPGASRGLLGPSPDPFREQFSCQFVAPTRTNKYATKGPHLLFYKILFKHRITRGKCPWKLFARIWVRSLTGLLRRETRPSRKRQSLPCLPVGGRLGRRVGALAWHRLASDPLTSSEKSGPPVSLAAHLPRTASQQKPLLWHAALVHADEHVRYRRRPCT